MNAYLELPQRLKTCMYKSFIIGVIRIIILSTLIRMLMFQLIMQVLEYFLGAPMRMLWHVPFIYKLGKCSILVAEMVAIWEGIAKLCK